MKCKECTQLAEELSKMLVPYLKKATWTNAKNAMTEISKNDGLFRLTFDCEDCKTEYEIIINKTKYPKNHPK